MNTNQDNSDVQQMNQVPKAVEISHDELYALHQMSLTINLDIPSAIEEILKDEDSFVIQAKDAEGIALDDFLVINAEKKQAARFINSVSSANERYSFLIPYDIIEEILLMMSDREETSH
jgi:hypothetical protein